MAWLRNVCQNCQVHFNYGKGFLQPDWLARHCSKVISCLLSELWINGHKKRVGGRAPSTINQFFPLKLRRVFYKRPAVFLSSIIKENLYSLILMFYIQANKPVLKQAVQNGWRSFILKGRFSFFPHFSLFTPLWQIVSGQLERKLIARGVVFSSVTPRSPLGTAGFFRSLILPAASELPFGAPDCFN